MDLIRPDNPNDYPVEWLREIVGENEDIVEWAAQQMLGLVPAEIQERYGIVHLAASVGHV